MFLSKKYVLSILSIAMLCAIQFAYGQCTPTVANNSPLCAGRNVLLTASDIDASGNGIALNGSDRLAIQNLNYNSTGITQVTVEAWINTSVGSDQIIASFDRSEYWRLEVNGEGAGTGQIAWSIATNSGILDMGGSVRVDDGNWHHVAGVYDNGAARIYVDGVLDGSANLGSTFGTGATRFGFIGTGSEAAAFNGSNGPTRYFQGEIDEVRIWNTALSQAVIAEWMDQEVQNSGCVHPQFASLQAYWQMNEGTGTTSADAVGSNTLTFVSTPTWIINNTAPISACYSWTGPNAFVSSEQNPVILSATTAAAGTYSLIARTRGCTSPTQNTNVVVTNSPAQPTASSPAAYCEGEAIANLTATANTSANPSNLNWYNDSLLTSLAGSGSPFTPITMVGSTVSYYVVETDGACEGPFQRVDVTVNASPTKPVITNAGALCEGDTLNLMTTNVDGNAGSAILLNNSDHLAIQNQSYSSTGITEVTVETWIKTSDGGDQIIASFDRSDFWRLEVNGSGAGTGQIGWDLLTNAGILDMGGSIRIDDGNWHHVAGVYDNGTASIYIDGVLDNSVSQGTSFGSSNTRFGFVGTGSEAPVFNGTTGPNDYFDGEMDEFRIWNVALSAATINGWKNQTVNASHPNFAALETYYRFDENSGTTANDSKNSNNGIFQGTPTWVSSSGAPIFLDVGWTGPNSFTSQDLNASVNNVTLADAGEYILTVTNAGGCESKDTFNLVVNGSPSPVTAPSPSPYCDGDAIANLTATTNPAGNEANIRWYEEASLTTLAGTGPSLAPTTVVGSTVDYFVVETNGTCESSSATQVDVTVNSLPTTPVLSSNSPICAGDSLKLNAVIDNEAGGALRMNNPDRLAIQNLSYSSNNIAEVTVEVWINTSSSADQMIASFDRSDYWRLEVNGSGAGPGQIGWDLLTNAGQLDMGGSIRVDDGNWHHVAAVYDNGVASIYIDGVLDNSVTRGTRFGTGSTRFGFIGVGSEATFFNGSTGPNSYFNGDIDEFRIWNTAVSAADINEWKDKPVDSNHPDFANLEAYYKFDETSGTTAIDSKNNNDATLLSTPTRLASSGAEIFVARSWTGPNSFTSNEVDPFIENATIAAQGTYTLTATGGGGCDESETIAVTVNDATFFESVQSGNWNSASTWSCNLIPVATTNIEIATGHTVTIDASSVANNLDVVGILEFSAGNDLTLNGDLDITGTVTPSTGELRMSGSAAQIIDASGTTNLHSLAITNNAGVSLSSGSFEMSGTLFLNAGTFATNNRLTLLSNSSGTARVNEISGGSVTGNVTVQRLINTGSTNWRFLSSPTQNQTLANWDDDFITSGYTGSDFPTFPFTSIYSYDETASGDRNNGYTAPTGASDPIGQAQGFWVWCGDTITGTQPFTIDVTGPLYTGDIAFPVSYTDDITQPASEDGWNMVGNPYASSIDWDDADWTRLRINDAIYIWDPDIQQYASYVGGLGTNGGSAIIASSQAFWVQSNAGSPVLTAREGVKSSVDQQFFKQKPSLGQVSIAISNGSFKDETIVVIKEDAQPGFDANYDARKLYSNSNAVPSIATLAGIEERSINALPIPNDDIAIPLKLEIPQNGKYVLNIAAQLNEKGIVCLLLEDRLTNTIISIQEPFTTLELDLTDSTINDRFYLQLGAPLRQSFTDVQCFGEESGAVEVEANGIGPWDFLLRDSLGNLIDERRNSFEKYRNTALSAGKYEVEVKNSGVCGDQSANFILYQPNEVIAEFKASDTLLMVGELVQFENASKNARSYTWNFGDGNGSSLSMPSHRFEEEGSYKVELIATTDSCSANKQLNIAVVKEEELPVTEQWLKVYAVEGNMVLKFKAEEETTLTLEMSDALGRSVFERSFENTKYLDKEFILDLPVGVYLVNVRQNNESATFKLSLSR